MFLYGERPFLISNRLVDGPRASKVGPQAPIIGESVSGVSLFVGYAKVWSLAQLFSSVNLSYILYCHVIGIVLGGILFGQLLTITAHRSRGKGPRYARGDSRGA